MPSALLVEAVFVYNFLPTTFALFTAFFLTTATVLTTGLLSGSFSARDC